MAKDKVNVRSKMLGGQSWISLLVKDAKGRGWRKNQKPRIRASKATEVKSCPFISQILSIFDMLGAIPGVRIQRWTNHVYWRLPLGHACKDLYLKGTFDAPPGLHFMLDKVQILQMSACRSNFWTSACLSGQVQEASKAMVWLMFLMLWLLLRRQNRKGLNGPYGLG